MRICFLIGGFFVYLLTVVNLDIYIFHPPDAAFHPNAEYADPNGKYSVVFFLIVYILIWL
jgi:hypothetical protein